MDSSYSIAAASQQHLDALPAIELEAASRFHGWPVPSIVLDDATPVTTFAAAQASGHLWVALWHKVHPVGFGMVAPSCRRLWLKELDVLPEHGRRGVGTALIDEIERWASIVGFGELVLTTYRGVPWNGPFYLRRGFEVIPPDRLDSELGACLHDEEQRGLASMPRVAMRLRTAG